MTRLTLLKASLNSEWNNRMGYRLAMSAWVIGRDGTGQRAMKVVGPIIISREPLPTHGWFNQSLWIQGTDIPRVDRFHAAFLDGWNVATNLEPLVGA